ncbi:plasmid SOS inhibition protein A [Erwinia sp. S63]|uniref:plasmid SOS inhibition protein A n=1 Tax=Erwinia sp. S63 TaxID=2769341 RepID=UPI00190B44C5|nr:plasmid SOS inhibition protein A [Erwinia sp. S63]MBK0098921.1 plasmid SOS inhibition protein A [Erwinia sp. S63]
MIPKSLSLVTLLPERQAALQAIAAVEHAHQRGTRLARHPYAAAFMKQLSGRSRVSVQALNRIRGIYLRPREKRAPLPEWEPCSRMPETLPVKWREKFTCDRCTWTARRRA